ncbi:MAG: TlyA family RNA methyltransferase [SAR324 cluster bacterium]|nr:TlyA family RNA methyltransferase [SAR324 cluster bacterium]
MKAKSRLDKLMVARGLAPSREKAQAYIIAGNVLVDDRKIEKPGFMLDISVVIRLMGMEHPYVSRGGLKLEKALTEFNITVQNRIAMDIGSSTGGFTDCLLQHGAIYVYAIDVGYGQLDWKLVTDVRVKSMEKTNFRYLTLADVGSFVDFIAIDVSFISLTKILQNCLNFLKTGGEVVALIKPQFEAGKKNIRKGGVVNDPKIRSEVIDSIKQHAESLAYEVRQIKPSPIQGKKSGNYEYLIHLIKPASDRSEAKQHK